MPISKSHRIPETSAVVVVVVVDVVFPNTRKGKKKIKVAENKRREKRMKLVKVRSGKEGGCARRSNGY